MPLTALFWSTRWRSTGFNDPDEADDLVQDTWTAALESPAA